MNLKKGLANYKTRRKRVDMKQNSFNYPWRGTKTSKSPQPKTKKKFFSVFLYFFFIKGEYIYLCKIDKSAPIGNLVLNNLVQS